MQRGGTERFGRGDVDDPRRFRFAQVRQCSADDALVRRQHHGQASCPCLVIAVIVDRDAHGDAGIVNDNVDPAEIRREVVDDIGEVVAVGDIERPGFCRTAP